MITTGAYKVNINVHSLYREASVVGGFDLDLFNMHKAGWEFYVRDANNSLAMYFYMKNKTSGLVIGKIKIEHPFFFADIIDLNDYVYNWFKNQLELKFQYIYPVGKYEKDLVKEFKIESLKKQLADRGQYPSTSQFVSDNYYKWQIDELKKIIDFGANPEYLKSSYKWTKDDISYLYEKIIELQTSDYESAKVNIKKRMKKVKPSAEIIDLVKIIEEIKLLEAA